MSSIPFRLLQDFSLRSRCYLSLSPRAVREEGKKENIHRRSPSEEASKKSEGKRKVRSSPFFSMSLLVDCLSLSLLLLPSLPFHFLPGTVASPSFFHSRSSFSFHSLPYASVLVMRAGASAAAVAAAGVILSSFPPNLSSLSLSPCFPPFCLPATHANACSERRKILHASIREA